MADLFDGEVCLQNDTRYRTLAISDMLQSGIVVDT